MEAQAEIPVTQPTQPKAKRSLGKAVLTALILVGLLVVCFVVGRVAFFALVLFLAGMALYELLHMLTAAGHRVFTPIPLAAGIAMLFVAFFEWFDGFAIVMYATAFLCLVAALRPERGEHPITDVAWSLLSVVWIGGGGAGAVLILMLPGGRLLLAAFVVVVVLGDIGAYFVGVERGRHKIAPSISPAKSWEGFGAGVICSLIAGAMVAGVLYHLSLLDGLMFGLLLAVVGPMGDLVESMAKREIGTKDSSHFLPGHGGFLDRMDAIVFATVPAYVFLRFIVL